MSLIYRRSCGHVLWPRSQARYRVFLKINKWTKKKISQSEKLRDKHPINATSKFQNSTRVSLSQNRTESVLGSCCSSVCPEFLSLISMLLFFLAMLCFDSLFLEKMWKANNTMREIWLWFDSYDHEWCYVCIFVLLIKLFDLLLFNARARLN